ncbi:MAG: hypothetical protein Q9183_006546, partial [Haloplaca sp. 2 TL-2023]
MVSPSSQGFGLMATPSIPPNTLSHKAQNSFCNILLAKNLWCFAREPMSNNHNSSTFENCSPYDGLDLLLAQQALDTETQQHLLTEYKQVSNTIDELYAKYNQGMSKFPKTEVVRWIMTRQPWKVWKPTDGNGDEFASSDNFKLWNLELADFVELLNTIKPDHVSSTQSPQNPEKASRMECFLVFLGAVSLSECLKPKWTTGMVEVKDPAFLQLPEKEWKAWTEKMNQETMRIRFLQGISAEYYKWHNIDRSWERKVNEAAEQSRIKEEKRCERDLVDRWRQHVYAQTTPGSLAEPLRFYDTYM